ncbi:MAG: hypothetical protein FWE60_00945, partial [Oscillospiraceae bacterium]|nr:hypothetical protein [Oscillospiraceae bacterium]
MNPKRQAEYSKMLSDFVRGDTVEPQNPNQNIYEKPRLDDFELTSRFETYNKKEKMFNGFFGLVVPLFVFGGMFGGGIYSFLLPLAMFAVFGIIAYIAIHKTLASRRMKQLLNDNIVRGALDEVMQVQSFVHNGHVSWHSVTSTKLLDRWNTITGNDFVQAKYRGVNIAFSDVHLKKVV